MKDLPPLDNLGYLRTQYLEKLWPLVTTHSLAKVIVGQRRSGKSTILKQLLSRILAEEIVTPDQVVYINFELPKWQHVVHATQLFDIIEAFIKPLPSDKEFFLVLDEIQEVEGWEKVVSGYLAESRRCHIFITGSNSKLLSSELATYLTGRYIEIEIHPLSYEEFLGFTKASRHKDSFIQYLSSSGIPELYHLPNQQEIQFSFLSSLKDSIVMKDIVRRYAIKTPHVLDLIFSFLIDNIGNLFSVPSLVNKLKSIGISTNVVTLAHYLNYLEYAYLIFGVHRYDMKGKRILEGEKKYYLNDLGFRNYFSSQFDPGLTKNLENYVFNTLKLCGYTVYVGRIGDLEIDFVAEKDRKRRYFQVTYLLSTEKVVEREYGNLMKCKDQWPKAVISLDDLPLPVNEGIHHIRAWEFEALLKNQSPF